MAEFHPLAVGGKGYRVIAHYVTGTHGGKTDGLARTRAGLPLPAIDGHLAQVTAQGIGHYLFDRLIEIARDRGIVNFITIVHPQNKRMIELTHRAAPGPIESRLHEGMLELTFRVGGEEPS